MERVIAQQRVTVNDEGFLTNFSQWNKNVAEELAKENNIALTPQHWKVIDYIQDEFKKDSPLSIRKIGKSGVVDIKELYALFPQAPLKTATKIAGVPKPASCI
ncbi:MAG TPA: TusE/DsrC/DsvC family sulfur relay protein [Chitinophagaceae bacterium]|jgi:tRNA 2-thiouridine synthesizing protein E|nr:TusE/DsrC/DsvC family sulfur relay protein [Chitinophagaceae bacterium]